MKGGGVPGSEEDGVVWIGDESFGDVLTCEMKQIRQQAVNDSLPNVVSSQGKEKLQRTDEACTDDHDFSLLCWSLG